MNPRAARDLLAGLLPSDAPVPGAVELWDGTRLAVGEPGAAPAFTVRVKRASALDALLAEPSLGFGEAYVGGDIEVSGDLGAVLALAFRQDLASRLSLRQKARAGWMRARRGRSVRQSRRDIESHYDRGNDFYRLWLDDDMNYSCAYFRDEGDSLETAQKQKNMYVLNKLRPRPGQRLLDVGCGWGALLRIAAEHHRLEAVGLTLSREQHAFARDRLAAAGLGGRTEVRLQDYREVPPAEDGTYDRIASVGMFEHVGRANLPVFFDRIAGLLKPGGILLLHTIGRVRPEPVDPWIEKHVFPGGYVPALGETVEAAARAGLEFLDLEDLRPHYDRTLGHWIGRFEAHAARIADTMGGAFVRLWRLYLHGAQMAFRHGTLHLFQFVFSRGRVRGWPMTREWMTAPGPPPAGGGARG